MQNSILCAIDFLASSRETLQWAIANAGQTNSSLIILHAYRLNRPENGESVLDMRKKIEENAHLNFEELEKDLLMGRNIPYEFKTEVGFLAARVQEYSRNHPIQFLVISKAMTNHKESFDDLVENMQVPVVIIP